MSYNIITKSLNTKLNGYQVSSLGAGNYLTLLSAPPLANVQLQLNDNTAPKIPFNEGDTLEAKGVDRVYITADIVSGGQLIFGQSNSNDFKITPAPKVKDIEKIGEITSFNALLLTALDKISNPYDLPTFSSGNSISTSYVTLLSKTLTCDKIRFILLSDTDNNPNYIHLFIDGVLVDFTGWFSRGNGGSGYYPQIPFNQQILEDMNGKLLEIKGKASTSYGISYNLEEFNLKV